MNAHTDLPRIFYRTVKPVRTHLTWTLRIYLRNGSVCFKLFPPYFLQNEPVWGGGHFREADIYYDLAVVR